MRLIAGRNIRDAVSIARAAVATNTSQRYPTKQSSPSPLERRSDNDFSGIAVRSQNLEVANVPLDGIHGPDNSTAESALIRRPSYPWDSNSCWLDTSLQLLCSAVGRNFSQFSLFFQPLPDDSSLRKLFEVVYARRRMEWEGIADSHRLREQRDEWRWVLKELGIISDVDVAESLCVWMFELVRREPVERSYRAASYFEALLIEIHSCSGSEHSGGHHLEITSRPVRRRVHELSKVDHEKFDGSFKKWFGQFISLAKEPVVQPGCWRNHGTASLCTGIRKDLNDLVVSLPVLLVVEVAESISTNGRELVWDFPNTVEVADGLNCVYDLVGLVLVSISEPPHFIARYSDHEHIYDYDDRQNGGFAILNHCARFEDNLGVQSIPISNSYRVYSAFYHLRGGVEVQDTFYQSRVKFYSQRHDLHFSEGDLSKLSSITYSRSDFRMLTDIERFWVEPSSIDWRVEYVLSTFPLQEIPSPLLPNYALAPNQVLPDISFQEDPSYVIRCRCGLLGRWTLACQTVSINEDHSDHMSIPYTEEVEKALGPFTQLLLQLVHCPSSLQGPFIPAKNWLDGQGHDVSISPVQFTGGLSLMERAQIANWFETFVGKEAKNRQKWINRLPLAHAHTLFIAFRLRYGEATSRYKDARTNVVLQKAWDILVEGSLAPRIEVDVEKECIQLLEHELFGVDPGGNSWGSDVGGNQDNWVPTVL
ncbi:hypothetical protein CVT26_012730 [Gymnopilus dilepis]|uniref:Uncharacterized protein n=1 Tax=Gymnopilus dilepis TaxID=231916 RepID=A0A409WV97_9AGAR|nr:hypothetical protein CVT26_012730 [Gymnopilus dilepis]